jgi:acyl dehydratase
VTDTTITRPFLLSTACERIGEKLGISDWVFIDQMQVNLFGELTHWRTPGHCDVEYAKTTRYGGTLMHGFHMLALLSHFYRSAELSPEDGQTPLNYGLDKVRVLQPVVIGDGVRLRSHITLLCVTPKAAGEYLLKTCHEIEVEGIAERALYAEYLTYWFPKKKPGG